MYLYILADEKFDEFCFEFGIELDEVTSERQLIAKEQGVEKAAHLSDETIYRVEIPANRYDLLTMEGLVRAVKAYLQPGEVPSHKTLPGPITVTVKPSTSGIRPYIACAVLRNIKMTQAVYDSLIDLQDKLHGGIGRRRTILSMGTYDLDTLTPNFTYDAVDPKQISFVPLNRTQVVDGNGLIQLLEGDLKLKKFLPIIRDSPVYPFLKDSNNVVLSVVPIINGDSSKITLNTKNIFIDVTGTDMTKVGIALNILTTTFARYCDTIESVKIHRADGTEIVTPNLASRDEVVSIEYINRSLGLKLSSEDICKLLAKMLLKAEPVNDEFVKVAVSAIRPDIMHACDIMEDVAIAYGFNKIPSRVPPTSCIGASNPINKLSDIVRREVALTGFSEVLTFSLCSHAENYSMLKKADPGNEAVVLSNPKTIEFEVVHTSLIPAMLKTLASNKKMPLPIRIYQVADIVLQDPTHEVGARNERRLCAVYCGMSSGLEIIHGLLDRVMLMLNVPMTSPGTSTGYYIKPSNLPTLFPGRQAEIFLNGKVVGAFGIIHPEVSANFDAPYVSSILELNIEPLL